MRRKGITGIVVVVLLVGGVGWFKTQNASSPVTLPGSPAGTERPPNEIEVKVSAGDWSAVRELLRKPTLRQKTLIQIIKNMEAPSSTAFQEEALNLLLEELKNDPTSVGERVLIYRGISYINLTPVLQRQVVETARKHPGDIALSVAHALSGTKPYPRAQEKLLMKELSSQKGGRNTDALFVVGVLKDVEAKKRITKDLLSRFPLGPSALHPHLAKFILVHADGGLKQTSKYAHFVSYVRAKHGGLWNEVHGFLE